MGLPKAPPASPASPTTCPHPDIAGPFPGRTKMGRSARRRRTGNAIQTLGVRQWRRRGGLFFIKKNDLFWSSATTPPCNKLSPEQQPATRFGKVTLAINCSAWEPVKHPRCRRDWERLFPMFRSQHHAPAALGARASGSRGAKPLLFLGSVTPQGRALPGEFCSCFPVIKFCTHQLGDWREDQAAG